MTEEISRTERSGLRGYVTNHEFGGLQIPVHVQNLILRDYAARNNVIFKLSVGEYFFENCYVQLYGLLKQLSTVEGLIMCSLFMLPKNPKRRRAICKEFIRQNAELHLVFESLVIRAEGDIERAEEIIKLHDTLRDCPKTIPRELLPLLSLPDSFT